MRGFLYGHRVLIDCLSWDVSEDSFEAETWIDIYILDLGLGVDDGGKNATVSEDVTRFLTPTQLALGTKNWPPAGDFRPSFSRL